MEHSMLVGRKQESEVLRKYHSSDKAEFLVVYRRRRVGKTFLVRQYFRDNFFFYSTTDLQRIMRLLQVENCTSSFPDTFT